MRDAVQPANAPKPAGPYSPGVRAGDIVFVSGQTGTDPDTGAFVPGGVREQARQALQNALNVVEAAGLSPRNVVKATIYLTDMNDFAAVNAEYATFFEAPYPARTTIAVAGLPLGARVEVELIAR